MPAPVAAPWDLLHYHKGLESQANLVTWNFPDLSCALTQEEEQGATSVSLKEQAGPPRQSSGKARALCHQCHGGLCLCGSNVRVLGLWLLRVRAAMPAVLRDMWDPVET